ncbi:MAG TPA: polysaccharide biosynthesis tyrosine autokinase [Candidatus Paceibacterota bacterium]|nr:polysaccharide biosynthesis tyrosine autokinase [Candidatus Paceibacterota bacterium]
MPDNHAAPPPKFRPQKLLFFLRKFWWLPLVTAILGFGVAVAIFFHTPPIFVSYGFMVETAKLKMPNGGGFSDDSGNGSDRAIYLGTMSQLLRDERLREMTTNRLATFNTNRDILNHISIPVDIQLFPSPDSSLYEVEARSGNPAYTSVYLDALMQSYLDYRKNTRAQVSADTLSQLSDQIQRLDRDRKTAQDALTQYEESNNFAVLVGQSAAEASYLVKLKTDLSDYQLDLQLLKARQLETDSGVTGATNDADAVLESLNGSGSGSATGSGQMDAEQQIEQLKAERDRLSKYLLPKHPKMVKLDEQIASAQKLLDFYNQQSHDQLNAERQALQIKIDSTQKFIKEYEDKVSDDNKKIATADSLKQDVLNNQGLLDTLKTMLQSVDISQHIDQDTLSILDPASSATRSYKEAEAMLIHSVIIGLILGLGIVFLMAWRDDRFMSVVEVTERFGDSVVGQVPEIPELSRAAPLALLDGNDDRHMYAESYRSLRSALLYLMVEGRRPKVVLITSAVPNEGKSTIATNLARTLAMGGSKVLLVDGDLRKGRIHERLKLQSKPGLSDLLRQPDDPGKFIQATDLLGFSFLSRGSTTRNPGDLFLSPAFDQILAQLRGQYDFILIDSCPVFAADDTSNIAPKADGTLFVVRSRFSHARAVREALELLFQRRAKVLGLVLNRSDSSVRSYQYYKYAEYYSSANTAEETEVSK